MFNPILRIICLVFIMLASVACSGLFDTDNTPAPSPLKPLYATRTPVLKWRVQTGVANKQYLKLDPGHNETAIFTSQSDGTVTSVDKMTARINWRVKPFSDVTTGPGVGDGVVVVGNRDGFIVALQAQTGAVLWKRHLSGDVLAKPAVKNGYVVAKSNNGFTQAFSSRDGSLQWTYQQSEPNLILRAASSPLIFGNNVLVGFANGLLSKMNLSNGGLIWERAIAYPSGGFNIQRMIDIDADPLVYDNKVYVATYQGKIASLTLANGNTRWEHDISSYTGMVADQNMIFVSDAKGSVWAFNALNGDYMWRQNDLLARVLSAPALMNHTIVVGDGSGFVHWLDENTGKVVARVNNGKTSITAKPIAEQNNVYVYSNDGYLSAYVVR